MESNVVIDEYIEHTVDVYMRMYPDSNETQVRQLVTKKIEESLVDIPCTLHNDTYHEYVDTTVLDTFNWLAIRKPIISGNGTFFKQHKEYTAPTIKVLETWLTKRKKLKKIMFSFPKGSIDYNNYNTGQNNQKVICNAEYGEAGSKLSTSYSVYLPASTTGSAKNLTTTLICLLELFVSNDDGYIIMKDINEMMDFIFNVLNDTEERPYRVTKYFTPERVAKRLFGMIRRKNDDDYEVLFKYACSLTEDEKSKLMLASNLKLLLSEFLTEEMYTIGTYLKQHIVDFDNCNTESLQLAGFGVTPPEAVNDLYERVSLIVRDSCIYPFIPNDVEARADNAMRDLVCVVDTDSLMLHYPKLINEFQTDTGNFKMSCICAAGFGTYLFANTVVPKYIDYFTLNVGIVDKYYRDKILFKNEFSFFMMILFQKKMYLNSMFVQEGNPRNIHEIDAKGVSFKKRDTADFLSPMILNLCDQHLISSDELKIDNIINEYIRIHSDIVRRVPYDVSLYTKQSVKGEDAYDASKTLPIQMRGSIIWNEIMSTEQILPLDRVYIIWLSYELLEHGTNPRTRRLLEICKRRSPKEACICIPESYKRIPDWISCGIDPEYNADKLLAPFKQLLNVFHVYLPENRGSFKCTKMLSI